MRDLAPGWFSRINREHALELIEGGDLDAKKNHVRRAKQNRDHHCHWTGCTAQVPPAKWGCYRHWMKLPKHFRDRIWAEYRIGQEINQTPSREYVHLMREVRLWISCEESGL